MNRILHARLWIWILYSRVQLDISRKILSWTLEIKFVSTRGHVVSTFYRLKEWIYPDILEFERCLAMLRRKGSGIFKITFLDITGRVEEISLRKWKDGNFLFIRHKISIERFSIFRALTWSIAWAGNFLKHYSLSQFCKELLTQIHL